MIDAARSVSWESSYGMALKLARKLEREVIVLRAAVSPFADYAVRHGAFNLVGHHGASIDYKAWIVAAEALNNTGPIEQIP